jgi:ADP-heptose:LPS heptosyltransferase
MGDTPRILLIRLGGLGDVVFTLPAVNAVKAAFPKARLTFLVYKEFATLMEGFPAIDSLITLDRAKYRQFNPVTVVREAFRLLRELRQNRFNLVIDFQGFGETGLLARWTGAPKRWGSVYRPARGWAYTDAIPRDPQLHAVDYQLDMLRRSGGIVPSSPGSSRFKLPQVHLAQARLLFQEWKLDESRATLLIQPFSNGEHKNWPLNEYLAVARHWQKQGFQVIFGGGPGEQEALGPARQAGFQVAAGSPLLVSAGLVGLSTVVLGGDTGLLHLAVAMGKRVVMIMGSKDPGSCFPYGHPEWALVPESGWDVAGVKADAVNESCNRAFEEQGHTSEKGATKLPVAM